MLCVESRPDPIHLVLRSLSFNAARPFVKFDRWRAGHHIIPKKLGISTKNSMAQIKGRRPSSNHHTEAVMPEVGTPNLLQPKDFSLPPMRRGPMYSVYAELREWKLRRKKAEVNSTIATPTRRTVASTVSRSVPNFSAGFRKENRKPASPLPPTGPRLDALMTPPRPMVPKAELRRLGSTSARRDDEKRGGGGVIEMRKSYSCLKELKEYGVVASSAMDEEARGGQSAKKGIVKKTVSGFQRQTTWMG